ncbi:SAM-dependent methyltransferase [Bacillus sp. FJAT-27225]|uniref:tRNA (adenine(22)-N(1))-methyltransferase n=1 Tax=Bacillus sp. FJAT-27225 TaxID=1743144 RepID=UPI00080C357B|nr:tRNA (adenine(22)-N(1))-methyltransferase TrmK [Bacillus sp. FJAT-27225]OCA91137.1 SAM-dependent methyltransferase [Bacillus sp. FJAT-27225]
MNAGQLSKRLQTVANYIPKGAKLADIGSDHAYLPVFLAGRGLIESAIAGEVVEGPYQTASRQVRAEGLEDVIAVRLGDGLEVVAPGEVDCISIAGMGGALITEILEEGKNKLDSVKRLVLQPNIAAWAIRKWLVENGWELIDEDILEEDSKIYEILVAERGKPERPYTTGLETGLLFGPFLQQRRQEAFLKKWKLEKENWQKVLGKLGQAKPSDEVEAKKADLQKKIVLVEEVLNL